MSVSTRQACWILIPLLAVGGLCALFYPVLLDRTGLIANLYKPVKVLHGRNASLPTCDHTGSTSLVVSPTIAQGPIGSSKVHSETWTPESGSADLNIYRAFRSRNISTPEEAERLSSEQRSAIEKEVRVLFPVAARAFKLYHSYLRSYNKCDYRLLADPGPCDRDLVSTLIVVPSLPASMERRMSIRGRILKFRMAGYRLVFITGRSARPVERELKKEADTYGDIIWADFFEDYDNLTIKTIMMLRWAERNCLSARYVVKADEDVYLHMANLEALLASNSNLSRAVMGAIGYKEAPYRQINEKWYMPSYMFSKANYPPFAHGPCYIVTTDLLDNINRVALTINYIHLEDIFLAVCLSFLNNTSHANIPNHIASSCSLTQAIACHRCTCS